MSEPATQPPRGPGRVRRAWRAAGAIRLGVVLLVVLAAASTVGVILPQPESFEAGDYIRKRLSPRSNEVLSQEDFVRLAGEAGILPRGVTLEGFVERAGKGTLADEAIRPVYAAMVQRAEREGATGQERLDFFFSVLGSRAQMEGLTGEEWRAFYAEAGRRIEAGGLDAQQWSVFLATFGEQAQGGDMGNDLLRLAYVDSYGALLGRVLVALHVHTLFSSLWFRLLCVLLIVNLVSCSLHMLPAQWRAAFGPRASKDPAWYARRRTHASAVADYGVDETVDILQSALREHGFRVRRLRATKLATLEGTRGWLGGLGRLWWPLGALAGLGRLGSQLVHLGVIAVLVGGFIAGLTSFRHVQILGPGDVVAVPDVSYRLSPAYQLRQLGYRIAQALGRDVEPEPLPEERFAEARDWRVADGEEPPDTLFRLRLRRFEFRADTQGKPEYFGSHVTVPGTDPPAEAAIEVNHPLVYRGFHVYQRSYQPDYNGITSVTLVVSRVRRSAPAADAVHGGRMPTEVLESFTVVVPPDTDYAVPGTPLTLRVLKYFSRWSLPFERTPEGKLVVGEATNRAEGFNPAVQLRVAAAGREPAVRWAPLPLRPGEARHAVDYGDYRIIPTDSTPDYNTWLTFKTNPVMLAVWVGCGLMMLGILLAFYCNHERIWALVQAREDGGCEVFLAGAAFKWRERFEERFGAVAAAVARDGGSKT